MRESALHYLKTARDVIISPFAFYRMLSVKEGVRDAMYFILVVLMLRSLGYFWQSYETGYFLMPEIKVSPVFTTGAFLFTLATPVLYLIILYVQSLFIVRIGNFFGGVGNLEGAFKIMAYTQVITLFLFVPIINIVARIFAIIVLIIGIREVFRTDWLSAVLTLFFSWLFTSVIYLVVFVPPAMLSGMFIL